MSLAEVSAKLIVFSLKGMEISHMSKKTKKPESNGVKRAYSRTTPVGRVCRRLDTMLKILAFSIRRMGQWSPDESDAVRALGQARNAESALIDAHDAVLRLCARGWLPPRRTGSISFVEGEEVRIAEKHQPKYLQIYTMNIIDNLHVAKLLPTGEIAVRYVGTTPFIVPKSHLERRHRPLDEGRIQSKDVQV